MTTTTVPQHRIVVVGGGAGGLPLATKLGDRYGRDGRVQVTLVDRNATHVWKPLLHEVAAGRMDADAHDARLSRDRVLASLPVPAGRDLRARPRAARGDARHGVRAGRRGDAAAPHAAVRHARRLRGQRRQRLRRAGRGAAPDLARHARRRRALPPPAACRVRARGRPRGGRRGRAGEHRDHRRRRDRRRAGRRDPPDDARARGVRPRLPRSRARHPHHAARGVAAHPAAAVRARRDRRRASCCRSSTSTCAPARA